MLFKLSLRNIRRSLRDYAVYFFTLMIGVAVFYVFNSIGGQAAILLMETVLIGLMSLAVGLLLGIGLSQLMSAVVASLFEADMSAYRFTVSVEAIWKTVLYFAVMYLVVMILNSGAVSRLKLIDLINSGKRSEQLKVKNQAVCVLVFLLAVAALSYAYRQVGWRFNDLNQRKLLVCIAMGAVSTFLIFWSLSGMLLRVVMSLKRLDILSYAGEYERFYTYSDEGLTFGDFFGDRLEEVKGQYLFLKYETKEPLIGLEDYNALAGLYGRESLSLEEGEYILLCDFKSMKALRDEILEAGGEITIFGQTLRPKYSECQDGFIDISAQHINAGIFVVPDSVLEGQLPWGDYIIGNYRAKDKEGKKATEEALRRDYRENLLEHIDMLSVKRLDGQLTFETKLDIAEGTVGLGAIITFVGLYIGLVFLIACGALLALKALSESVDSVGRYEILRKIGTQERDISRSLFHQIGVFFLLPLLLACIHSVFGMKFSVNVLEVFGMEKIGESVFLTAVFLLVIYGGYFLITYISSKNIINGSDGNSTLLLKE